MAAAAQPEFGSLQLQLDRLQANLSPVEFIKVATPVGKAAQRDLVEVAKQAVGSDLMFSGWRRLGKLGSTFRIDGTAMVISPVPYGGWIVADKGRRPGSVAPRRSRQVTFKMPWGPRTYLAGKPLKIGASRGKNTLTAGKALIRLRTPARVERIVRQQIKKSGFEEGKVA